VVAVVGATGLVGQVLLSGLEQRGFPVGRLVPMAGPGSAGKKLTFAGQEYEIQAASPEGFHGVDLVFFAATGELSKRLAPAAVAAGAFVIDKSASWRMAPEVPLIVPEVNGAALRASDRLVASPNCTTTGLVMALEPLRRAAGLKRVHVTTLQAASGAGRFALEELGTQAAALGAGETPVAELWPEPLAGNVLPRCDELEPGGSSREERKLCQETRKILNLPNLELAATCTRVPVAVGHCASVWIETERDLDPAEARDLLQAFPGVEVAEDPTPASVAGRDEVQVGRIRRPLAGPGLQFWQVSDNLRKGAATNAIQIAEYRVRLDLSCN